MGRKWLYIGMDGAMARPWNRVVARMVMLPMRRERESHILYRLPLPLPDVPGKCSKLCKKSVKYGFFWMPSPAPQDRVRERRIKGETGVSLAI